jgi:hypothetical protein
MCGAYFRWFSDWWNQFFLTTIQTLKSGACGGPFLKIHRIECIFLSSLRRFCLQKNKAKLHWKDQSRNEENNTKSGPCLESSCATIFLPWIPAHLIWCILHTACTLFPGTYLKLKPPPYLRKLTHYRSHDSSCNI